MQQKFPFFCLKKNTNPYKETKKPLNNNLLPTKQTLLQNSPIISKIICKKHYIKPKNAINNNTSKFANIKSFISPKLKSLKEYLRKKLRLKKQSPKKVLFQTPPKKSRDQNEYLDTPSNQQKQIRIVYPKTPHIKKLIQKEQENMKKKEENSQSDQQNLIQFSFSSQDDESMLLTPQSSQNSNDISSGNSNISQPQEEILLSKRSSLDSEDDLLKPPKESDFYQLDVSGKSSKEPQNQNIIQENSWYNGRSNNSSVIQNNQNTQNSDQFALKNNRENIMDLIAKKSKRLGDGGMEKIQEEDTPQRKSSSGSENSKIKKCLNIDQLVQSDLSENKENYFNEKKLQICQQSVKEILLLPINNNNYNNNENIQQKENLSKYLHNNQNIIQGPKISVKKSQECKQKPILENRNIAQRNINQNPNYNQNNNNKNIIKNNINRIRSLSTKKKQQQQQQQNQPKFIRL